MRHMAVSLAPFEGTERSSEVDEGILADWGKGLCRRVACSLRSLSGGFRIYRNKTTWQREN